MESCKVFSSHFPVKHGFFGKGLAGTTLAENVKNVQEKLGAKGCLILNQQHTCQVQVYEDLSFDPLKPCDSVITSKNSFAIGVRTADCAPVLLYAPAMIAAAHAGWRGACAGILQETLSRMMALGAKKEEIIAMIGPCIAWQDYEIKQDCKDVIMEKSCFDPEPFFKTRGAQLCFDLGGYCQKSLEGIKKVIFCGINTFSHSCFYSYRRNLLENKAYKSSNLSYLCL